MQLNLAIGPLVRAPLVAAATSRTLASRLEVFA